jgi:unsaturated rhamnogalacturonyl hydrolase
VVLAQAEVLAALPAGDSRQDGLLAQFTRQAAALAARQAPNGMWHTVVTRTDFYQETSATALIAAGLATAVAHGFGDALAVQAAEAGAKATWQQVSTGGLVGGVSGPTGPMDQEGAYNTILIEPFNLYGQGIVLWLGAATMPAS